MYFRFDNRELYDALFKLMAYYVLNNEAEIRIREVNCLRTYEHHQSVYSTQRGTGQKKSHWVYLRSIKV